MPVDGMQIYNILRRLFKKTPIRIFPIVLPLKQDNTGWCSKSEACLIYYRKVTYLNTHGLDPRHGIYLFSLLI